MKKGLHPSKQSIKDQSNESIATGSAWENLRESVSKTKKLRFQVYEEKDHLNLQTIQKEINSKWYSTKITANPPPSSTTDSGISQTPKHERKRPTGLLLS